MKLMILLRYGGYHNTIDTIIHLYIKLAFRLTLQTDKLSQPSELKSGTSIIARFGDMSASTILKFLKFVTLSCWVKQSHTALQ